MTSKLRINRILRLSSSLFALLARVFTIRLTTDDWALVTMTDAAADTLTVQLTLTGEPSSPRVPLTIEKTASPTQLRAKVAETTKIPIASLKLIFRGRLISDDDAKQVVSEFKLEDQCVLHCMGKPVATQETASATTGSPSTTAAGSSVSFFPPGTGATPSATMAGSTVSFLPSGSASSATPTDPLQVAFSTLRSSNSSSVYLTAVTTLEKILSNCVNHPMEEKYRSVKKQNAAFQRRLGGLPGGDAAMLAAGFVVEGQGADESYVLRASAEAWPKLVATKARVEAAVREAKSSTVGSVPPPAGGFGSMTGMGAGNMTGMGAGMPGIGAGGMPGMGSPEMQNAMASMLSDPNALQSMLQNPMVRNMVQNDPRFANNPQLSQILDNPQMLNQVSQMMSNPAMRSQMQSMMSDPTMRSQMQSMMNGQGGIPAAPNPPAANPPHAGGNAQPSDSQRDEEMTEEEMIAEAIQRSLRES